LYNSIESGAAAELHPQKTNSSSTDLSNFSRRAKQKNFIQKNVSDLCSLIAELTINQNEWVARRGSLRIAAPLRRDPALDKRAGIFHSLDNELLSRIILRTEPSLTL
jgi:hypothetical protein